MSTKESINDLAASANSREARERYMAEQLSAKIEGVELLLTEAPDSPDDKCRSTHFEAYVPSTNEVLFAHSNRTVANAMFVILQEALKNQSISEGGQLDFEKAASNINTAIFGQPKSFSEIAAEMSEHQS